MPYKSRKPCAFPGCPALLAEGEYCVKHRNAGRPHDQQKWHYDRHWRNLRGAFLARHPLCAECECAGRLTPATEVHHIKSLSDGGTDAADNLMPLCKSCHSRKSLEELNRGR